MTRDTLKGRIHSFQSLGTVDGPGIRFVVFMQGCPLRCGCCHNPDTWSFNAGNEYTDTEVLEKVLKYKEYFGKDGGITLSGGEPLLQADFAYELFRMCHDEQINTCLDTSGCVLNENIKKLLTVTDRVLLDIKYTDEESYKKFVGCEYSKVLDFLAYLCDNQIPVTLRQVIIPGLNDSDDNIYRLHELKLKHQCIDNIELLSFRKICQVKYDSMGIEFPFKDIPEPDKNTMNRLKSKLQDNK